MKPHLRALHTCFAVSPSCQDVGCRWHIAGTTKEKAGGKQAAAKALAEASSTRASLPAPSNKQRVRINAVQLGVDELVAEGGAFVSVHAEFSLSFSPMHHSHSLVRL